VDAQEREDADDRDALHREQDEQHRSRRAGQASVGLDTPDMPRVQFTLHNSLTAWQFGPFRLLVAAGILALATWYYFQAHVIQHLLLMVVGPLLLALGAPSTLLLQTASRRGKQRWLRILHSRPFAVISHPLTAWVLYYGVMYMFFLTPIIGFSMEHMALMDVINFGFLAGATLFWWPTIGIDPAPRWKTSHAARMLNLFIGMPVETWLGISLMNESRRSAHADAPIYTLASIHSLGGLLSRWEVALAAPVEPAWTVVEPPGAASAPPTRAASAPA